MLTYKNPKTGDTVRFTKQPADAIVGHLTSSGYELQPADAAPAPAEQTAAPAATTAAPQVKEA